MKKIFSLCAAVLVALAANAQSVTSIEPGTGGTLTAAIGAASDGDIIELANGTYTEGTNDAININKSITIRAAAGASPIVKNKCYFMVQNGKAVTVQDIKFDGTGANDHCFRAHSSSTGAENVVFERCEFYNWPSYVLYTQKDPRRWNSLIVKNCYFHDNTKYAIAVFLDSGTETTCKQVTVENSTFANTAGDYPAIYIANGNATQLNVDHCTFYNFGTYFIKDASSAPDITVSNCIFAQPDAKTYSPVSAASGTVDHCLAYNQGDYASGLSVTNGLTGDPKFADAANGDYTISVISPAFKAGGDGKHLGDSRWWPKPIADGYYLIYADWNLASLGGKFEVNPDKTTEYMLNVDLTLNYGIKVCKVENEAITAYYPDGMGNEYIVDADHAGKKCIYFDGTSHGDWLAGGYIWIGEWVATGINNVEAGEKAVKMIENGQLVIIKNGVKYNVVGSQIK